LAWSACYSCHKFSHIVVNVRTQRVALIDQQPDAAQQRRRQLQAEDLPRSGGIALNSFVVKELFSQPYLGQ
jgi:hypothetical protein